jgi:hypothetical protein
MRTNCRIVHRGKHSEIDLTGVFFKEDLKDRVFEGFVDEFGGCIQRLALKDEYVPMFMEFTIFNFQNTYSTTATCYRQNLVDIVVDFLHKTYETIQQTTTTTSMNDQLIIDFEDFLTRYLLAGGFRLRLSLGYSPSWKDFDPSIKLSMVKRHVREIRKQQP